MERLPDAAHARRLQLRRWVPADAEALNEAVLSSLDHLRPWMPWAKFEPLTVEGRRELICEWQREWEAGGDVVLGALNGLEIVGGSGLRRRQGAAALEIGYWVHVGHVRLGYAAELSEALTDLAFGVAEIERVEIHHDQANVASSGVPRRLGFELISETPDEISAPGEIGIDCTWAVTREAWVNRIAQIGDT